MEAGEDVITSFYTYLQNKVSRVYKNDIVIIIGDFDAREEFGKRMNYSVMGMYGFRQRNDGGEQLFDLCYANDLNISNTKFSRPNHHYAHMQLN